MRISVVVITYNRRDFVIRTLDAVLAQSRPADEIVVVDDGSTDGTATLLRDRYGKKIRLIEQQNAGCEAARATGIEAVTGDWIAPCDSDDLWRADHLARLEALVRKYPATDIAFTNFAEFGNQAQFDDKFASMPASFWIGVQVDGDRFCDLGAGNFTRLLDGNPFFPSAGLFRMETYRAIGGIRRRFSRNGSSDLDMICRYAIVGRLAADFRISVDINKHGSNISAASPHASLGRLEILADNLQEGGIFAPFEARMQQAYRKAASDAMWTAFYFRDTARFSASGKHLAWRCRSAGLQLRSIYMVLLSLYRRWKPGRSG
jgi:hypothetical protein